MGHPYAVAVQVQAGEQVVDVAGVFLNYDPTMLELESVIPEMALDTVLRKVFDNATGTFSYEAGKLGGSFPSGTFTLVTLRFIPLQEITATRLTFSQKAPRQTDVYRNGVDYLHWADALTVAIGPAVSPLPEEAPVIEELAA